MLMKLFPKKPFFVKLFCDKQKIDKIDAFFSEENASLFPFYVQDNINNTDIFEQDDFNFIMLIDEISLDYISTKLKEFNILYEIKDITIPCFWGEYPFEISIGKQKAIEELIMPYITPDDVLEKITQKGLSALTEHDIELLKSV